MPPIRSLIYMISASFVPNLAPYHYWRDCTNRLHISEYPADYTVNQKIVFKALFTGTRFRLRPGQFRYCFHKKRVKSTRFYFSVDTWYFIDLKITLQQPQKYFSYKIKTKKMRRHSRAAVPYIFKPKDVTWKKILKGKLQSKQKLSLNKRPWKMQKTKWALWPQCAKWFSRYPIPKSWIWTRWTSPFCRFSASFSCTYDVTDAIRQNNEKMKVQYLSSLLFDLFEILQDAIT